MTENPIEREIRASGADDSVVFVFPSDIAATLWLEASLAITMRETLPSRRFIAWDRFKERAVQASVAGKQPVTAILRKLYALDLARRNRESAEPLFTALIPEAFAESGAVFAPWIARILPSLALLERKRRVAGKSTDATGDGEDKDLASLKADYSLFLDANSLFEPSWQMPPLRDTGDRFVVFFPEAIEDFTEYEPLLAGAPFITTVSAFPKNETKTGNDIAPAKETAKESAKESANTARQNRPVAQSRPGELDFGFGQEEENNTGFAQAADSGATDQGELSLSTHATTRDEFKSVALEIESLLRSGVAPESIAVSVPDLESVAPYLLREFTLRAIPFEYRAGANLGSCPSGRFFARSSECVSSGYAFTHFKALLLDRSIPWKARDLAEALVEFGIRNHCVTGWKDDGKMIDVWDAAFRDPACAEAGDWRIRDFYRELKTSLSALVGAKTYSEIRNRWFAFREGFLDMELLSAEDDAVLARCVEELGELASLEARFPNLVPPDPFSLFAAVLDEKKYVRRRAATGVNIFPYRVAAGTPFPWHFVVDASQDGATVVYSPLEYLRQDKRDALGLSDVDASRAFFELYRRCPLSPSPTDKNETAQGVRFSCAGRSFSGYRIPHSAFAGLSAEKKETAIRSPSDPFALEAAWLSGSVAKPDRLYPVQKKSFASWSERSAARGFSYLESAYEGRLDPLTERIRARLRKENGLLVTATHLNAWSTCGAKLFLSKILNIQEETQDAELLNERNLGILYHDVLCAVYEKIRDTDGAFRKEKLDEYRQWTADAAKDSARAYSEFRGPLAAPLVDTLADRVIDGACSVLESDAELLDGFAPVFLEGELSYAEGGLSYYGRIDRISADDSGTAVLIDYKSGYVTPTGDYAVSPDGTIKDCQIPMYAYLAERAEASPCKGATLDFAWFGDIKKRKYQPVIHDRATIPWNARSKLFSRDEFTPAMEAFSSMTTRYADGINREDFTRPQKLSWTECLFCDFRKICRYVYSVRP